MMNISKTATRVFKQLSVGLMLITFFASCKKDKLVATEKEPVTSTRSLDMVPYYKVQRVENLQVETDDSNPTAPKPEVLFSLDYKKMQPATYGKTSFWDISFSGLYNSFMGGNNGSNSDNAGYTGPGAGGITILAKSFEDLTDIPVASAFKTARALIGTDDMGEFGVGIGWYLYDFNGSIVGDGSYDKKHVAYALGNAFTLANGQKTQPRTIIVRTAKGDFAKIKMISCYKDVFTTDKMMRNTPHMFFTFEYVIVPAGSTKFEIK
ncbi:hypothetical protein [Pedobacter sp. GR22-10]|uniref:hypothetical protein n=1 Tax=Pedobacter sp. GR22-10 TaxID=2994472 RepID=UPI00224767E5|nr:hypothetical protein [Pedobacter sp. GR22-10]MCX2430792.1 hypothetical protein [Pedobacter sp. GR22-10]